VMVNPYTIYKSRTGGVISRLLTRTALDLVGGVMMAPGPKFVEEFAATIVSDPEPRHRATQEQIREYVLANYAPDAATGRPNRTMLLLFRGKDAVRKTFEAVGHIRRQTTGGETVRDTFGDCIYNRDGSLRYFEPAVLTAPTAASAKKQLAIIAKHVGKDSQSGLLEGIAPTFGQPGHQRTLVIIKPDNFRFPSGRPGNVIDLFSRAGLAITGMKVHRMSVAEAEAFYSPILPSLREKLGIPAAARVKELIQSALALPVSEKMEAEFARLLGPVAGEERFQTIVQFMAGKSPRECRTAAEKKAHGSEKCIVLVYEGIDAVRKIREVLGPTDPSQAPPGSIRREFGQTMMINAAHASDSAANAEREIGIVKMKENNFKSLIQASLKS